MNGKIRIAWIIGLFAVSMQATEYDAATATNQCGTDVFRQIVSSAKGRNVVLSPYSIESALALAYSGADGTTREEMSHVLRLPADETRVAESLKQLRAALDDMRAPASKSRRRPTRPDSTSTAKPQTGPIEWYIANRLFAQQGYAFRPEFLERMRTEYQTPLEAEDFARHSERVRTGINEWVAKETRGRISDVIPIGGLNDTTRLVLVNALYLKAMWETPFEKSATRFQPFHFRDGTTHEVETMQRTAYLGYAKQDNATIVTLPYAGNGLQLAIILPDADADLGAIIRDLDANDFSELARIGQHHIQHVALWMPKFTTATATLELNGLLGALGMSSAFDQPVGSANFDRIAPRKPNEYLALSKVFHRTYVAVDEEGTVAAAATADVGVVVLGIAVEPKKPIEVHVDRPFLFAIQHIATKTCLFLGVINDPR